MKIKLLATICILFFLTLAFLPNTSFAQRKTTSKTPVKPTPTPATRDVIKPNDKTKTAEKRLALVIGNANYQFAGKLRNPVNDARDMATTLRKLGFTVIDGYDLTLSQIEEKVQQFGNQLKARKGVGLVYYAGHGIQFNGSNYLIPIDANIKSEQETKYKGLNLGLILDTLDSAANGFNLIILDACRNNPFARSWNRDAGISGGLASTDAPSGTFIAYATKPGGVAADGTGRNGTFTAELLNQIQVPNLNVEQIFKNVRTNVLKQTNNRQLPWDSSSLVGDFYFSGQGNPAVNPTSVNVVTETRPPSSNRSIPSIDLIEANYRSNLIDDVIRDAKNFLEEQPNHPKANLMLGLSLFSKTKFQESMPYIEKALVLGEVAGFRTTTTQIWITASEFRFDEGKNFYLTKWANIKSFEIQQTAIYGFQILVKGDFNFTEAKTNKIKEKKNKEFLFISHLSQSQTYGPKQILGTTFPGGVMKVCKNKDCETWTTELVRLFNRCKTGEIQRNLESQTTSTQNRNQISDTNYSASVNLPSENYFNYESEKFQISIPTNWRNVQSNDITFAPENAHGKDGITHGLLIMFVKPKSGNLDDANKEHIQILLNGNSYLSKEVETSQGKIDGQVALITGLAGLSPITKKKEMVFLYSTLLKDKRLLTFAFVCPTDEMITYLKTIQNMTVSIRLKD